MLVVFADFHLQGLVTLWYDKFFPLFKNLYLIELKLWGSLHDRVKKACSGVDLHFHLPGTQVYQTGTTLICFLSLGFSRLGG